ncbi:MAG: hypothetical protein WC307_00860 [Candidatus Nanoarchaeia archaeon]|jgi:hypothetical protein
MKKELALLKKDYSAFKSVKGDLNISELRDAIKLGKKLDELINQLQTMINNLDESLEYGQSIVPVRAKLKKELKNLLVLKETV